MTWEELLTTKGYVYIGQCCGGWSKYTPKANLNERGRVIDAMKIIRTRRDKFKIPANRGILTGS